MSIIERINNLDDATTLKLSIFLFNALLADPALWTAKNRTDEQLAEIEKFLEKNA